jgi:CrcB protein
MVAGSLGTLARYGISIFFNKYAVVNFPIGVFAANMLGSFLFGLIWALSEDKGIVNSNMRLIILVGFMGSFTTFSTFAFDNTIYITQLDWAKLVLNILANNIVGIFLIYLGFKLAKLA